MMGLLPWCILLLNIIGGYSSFIELHIYYPEANVQLNSSLAYGDVAFQYAYSTSPYSLEIVEKYINTSGYFPWQGNYSYFITNSSDYVGKDHWMKTIDVGESTTGTVYLELFANVFIPYTIKTCKNMNTWGSCMPRHAPSYVQINDPSETVLLNMYPAFDITGFGQVSTIFSNYYSSSLGNYRDISLYLPYSLIENPIRREVNVLLLYDGDLATTQLMALNAGFDMYAASGSVPETIIIGIPPGANGTACPTGTCSQRIFEMTPTGCDPSLNNCQAGQAYGGTSTFLTFSLGVISDVLASLNLDMGELSSFGTSLGGLTACYAVSAFPSNFSRAFCGSPSTWWNSGEISSIITSNYAKSQILPKSVVISIGTQEGNGYLFLANQPTVWMQFITQMNDAFLSIGMGKIPPGQDATETHDDGQSFPSLNSNLVYFTYTGGVHIYSQWVDVFSYGVSLMYAADYPYAFHANNKLQKNTYVSIQYPVQTTCDLSDDDADSEQEVVYFALMIVFGALTVMLAGIALSLFLKLRQLQKVSALLLSHGTLQLSEVDNPALQRA